ncbi:Uncharacterised protein [Mycobacteroides abscessus subsp. massiliense]|nr:Uncharacterised protein [Mycobacteroides abscessus subsp. massiliense]
MGQTFQNSQAGAGDGAQVVHHRGRWQLAVVGEPPLVEDAHGVTHMRQVGDGLVGTGNRVARQQTFGAHHVCDDVLDRPARQYGRRGPLVIGQAGAQLIQRAPLGGQRGDDRLFGDDRDGHGPSLRESARAGFELGAQLGLHIHIVRRSGLRFLQARRAASGAHRDLRIVDLVNRGGFRLRDQLKLLDRNAIHVSRGKLAEPDAIAVGLFGIVGERVQIEGAVDGRDGIQCLPQT